MKETEVLKQIIATRRSTYPRDYTGEEISQGIIEEVIASAGYAPNHKKTRPWRFQVFRDDDKVTLANAVAELYKQTTPAEIYSEKKSLDFRNKIGKADTVVSISVNFSGLLPEWEEIAATAMAVQNMYLTCNAHRIGCYWSSHKVTAFLSEFLGLDEDQRCLGLFYMGKV